MKWFGHKQKVTKEAHIDGTEDDGQSQVSWFSRLTSGLSQTSQSLVSGLENALGVRATIDDDVIEALETELLMADVGVATTKIIIDQLIEAHPRKSAVDVDAVMATLTALLVATLSDNDHPLNQPTDGPLVILVVGVNGAGKTTTIGKLAHRYLSEGQTVMLAAGDTFRAAAVEQLQAWGERNNVPVIAQHTGADSASVLFDALTAARARNVDVLLADTAGRLNNKAHLMEELEKIVRVIKKADPSAPHETLLVLDSGTGQNAVSQAREFDAAVGVTGIALTKLDGTAKGGVVFAIGQQIKRPIRYIGIGEGIEDLRPFNAHEFVDALFSTAK
ncbi:MAG: signal recognition particle-docking protein FtsY [Halieaceae bacterium]|jgi:fused signal recognition particle receptor|nr:signal recognition particle-docking protein FtsY [Halieaceae bacterium]MBT5135449.1 signal recognition particle-docking protein FtsY [Halieaceae bacterium]MBT5557313.1 signal recognition particle-docking protein FtsY [Halieaceae bacterium]MBT6181335.1 signal recognition particle-docking protein FtsY [Halieaceae bacterium]MDG1799658.1 signal recognition particle-docking protein FtsY [Luminiphilus sp.]